MVSILSCPIRNLPKGWCFSTIGDLFQHNTGKALNGRERDGLFAIDFVGLNSFVKFVVMDKNTIIEALRKGERISLECKLAQSEVPSSVWSSYSAFANTYGGLILLGVNEDLTEPELIEQPELMQVKLILHIASEEDAVKRQANVVNDVVNDVGKDVGKELTERQLVIIDLIDKVPYISPQKMSEKMSEMPGKGIVATRTVERDLAVLKELGVLTRISGRKDGHWEINKELLPSLYRAS